MTDPPDIDMYCILLMNEKPNELYDVQSDAGYSSTKPTVFSSFYAAAINNTAVPYWSTIYKYQLNG